VICDLGIRREQVLLLLLVRIQIEEILTLAAAQQFPFPLPNGGLRNPPPHQRVVRRAFFPTGKKGNQIHAVEFRIAR
jgi:hypothetical protein